MVVDQIDSLPEGTDLVVRALTPSATATYGELLADYSSAVAHATKRATERAGRR